jgi:hypothetical protein
MEGYIRAMNQAHEWMLANKDAAVAALKTYFPETDEATLRISFEALLPAIRQGGKLTQTAIANQVSVLKAIGAVEGAPDTTEGVLWTNKWNR